MGIMPKQTKAENKLKFGLTLNRLIGLFITIMISTILSKAVHRYLTIPFMLVCVGVYLFSQSKSPTNPKKNFITGLKDCYLYILSPKKYYGVDCDEYKQALLIEEERNEKKKKQRKDSTKK